MGQADWTELGSSLSTATVKRGVGPLIAPPNGGGDNTFVFNSIATAIGAVGFYCNLSGFSPSNPGTTPIGGGAIAGAMKRVSSPSNTGFSPFLFICAEGGPPSVNDNAYMVGLSDADPYRIMLAKAPLISGLNEAATDFIKLAESSAQYAMADQLWHHLMLAARVQPNGDVLLKVYSNDVDLHGLDAPASFDWQPITGISVDGIIDDNTAITTGTDPLWGGYAGYGYAVNSGLYRRAAFSGLQIKRDA